MSKKKTDAIIRRHFSVSKEFHEVVDILDSQPEGTMSRFVCEAILHYNEVKNNPDWMIERLEKLVGYHSRILSIEQATTHFKEGEVGAVEKEAAVPARQVKVEEPPAVDSTPDEPETESASDKEVAPPVQGVTKEKPEQSNQEPYNPPSPPKPVRPTGLFRRRT